MIYIKQTEIGNQEYHETIESYCQRISRKNNSILYKLEEYLGKKLLTDEDLISIRDTILTVSAEIKKIPENIVVGDNDERL